MSYLKTYRWNQR